MASSDSFGHGAGAFVMDAAQSLLRMGQLALVRRELAWVRRDRGSGGWRHRYRAGSLVSPLPRGVPWKIAEQKTMDIFCYGYVPVEGDVVLELGSEYGTETVTLSRLVGQMGAVIAVEAHPWTCELLRRTVDVNGLSNVTVVQAAVSGATGQISLTDGPRDRTRGNTVVSGRTGIDVPSISIDGLLKGLDVRCVDLLKMNIEGAESDGLKGMTESVAFVQNLVVSCHDFKADQGDGEFYRTRSMVFDQLIKYGYEVADRPDDDRPWVRDYLYASRH